MIASFVMVIINSLVKHRHGHLKGTKKYILKVKMNFRSK